MLVLEAAKLIDANIKTKNSNKKQHTHWLLFKHHQFNELIY
jgi:hypothetical protein